MAKPVASGSAAPGEASSGKPKRVLPSPGKAAKQPTRKGPAGGTGGIVIDGGVTRHDVPPRGQGSERGPSKDRGNLLRFGFD